MQGTQDTVTEGRIARIAQGGLDPEEASQLLGKIFDTEGYFTILCGYSEAQQQRYIDGLYEVYYFCFYEHPFHLAPIRLLVASHLIRRCASAVSGRSGRPEQKQDYFQPVTAFHFNLRNKMNCRTRLAGSRKSGKRTALLVPPMHLRSFV